MADYHIYLHSDQSSSIVSNTQPKEESMGGVFAPINAIRKVFNGGIDSAINTGVATLVKALPGIAVGYALTKTADKILTTGFGHLETYTGHYEYSMGLNNFKTGINLALHPQQTLMKMINISFEQNKINKRQDQVRSLIGQTQKVGV